MMCYTWMLRCCSQAAAAEIIRISLKDSFEATVSCVYILPSRLYKDIQQERCGITSSVLLYLFIIHLLLCTNFCNDICINLYHIF